MAKMTLEELRKLREQKKKEMTQRASDEKTIQIVVGMGTCGIAAGAKETLAAFLDELDIRGVEHARITQTGCMGLCHSEPTVKVLSPGMPPVIYGKVDAETARRIVREHLMQNKLVSEHIFDQPAADLIN